MSSRSKSPPTPADGENVEPVESLPRENSSDDEEPPTPEDTPRSKSPAKDSSSSAREKRDIKSPERKKKKTDRSPIRDRSRSSTRERSPEKRHKSSKKSRLYHSGDDASSEDESRMRKKERREERRSKGSRRDREKRSRDHSENRRRRSRSDERSPKRANVEKKEDQGVATKKEQPLDLLRTRTGGAYIPPAKLKLMQEQMADKSSEQYQRMNWERLKKKIHGLVNRVNVGNLVQVVRELLQENVIRGKGLLTRSIIQAQAFSPTFSHVYAALVAVINSKFPHIGELLLRRLIVQFKRSFRRNDKGVTVTVTKFIAHLINQHVAHEVLALEIMLLMLEQPTDDSVEVSIALLKECGAKLMDISPIALNSVYERLNAILRETSEYQLDKRVTYMIEVALQIRKDKFSAYPAVIDDLDLIEEEDQITHTINLEQAVNPENELNVFKLDPDFEKTEAQYEEIRSEIIGDADISDEEESEDENEDDEEEQESVKPTTTEIIDNTEQNLVAFRREIYLTIQSSLDYQEAAHKLLKMKIKPELDNELCNMLVDCCVQSRTYERFYGLLIERFCRLRLEYQQMYEKIARDAYATIHRFENTKLKILARLIAHLLYTDAISWTILGDIKMSEADTSSSGRIYIKCIFQELVEAMGLVKLYERTQDLSLASAFAGLFPRDSPENARFAINFFTMIGLGGLTLDLREWLQKGMKRRQELANEVSSDESDSSDSSDDSSDSEDSSDDSSDDSDDSSSSSSDSEDEKRKKRAEGKTKDRKKDEKSENKTRKVIERKEKEEVFSDAEQENRRHQQKDDRRREAENQGRSEKRRHAEKRERSKEKDDRNENREGFRDRSDERGSRRDRGERGDRKRSGERRDRGDEGRQREKDQRKDKNDRDGRKEKERSDRDERGKRSRSHDRSRHRDDSPRREARVRSPERRREVEVDRRRSRRDNS